MQPGMSSAQHRMAWLSPRNVHCVGWFVAYTVFPASVTVSLSAQVVISSDPFSSCSEEFDADQTRRLSKPHPLPAASLAASSAAVHNLACRDRHVLCAWSWSPSVHGQRKFISELSPHTALDPYTGAFVHSSCEQVFIDDPILSELRMRFPYVHGFARHRPPPNVPSLRHL